MTSNTSFRVELRGILIAQKIATKPQFNRKIIQELQYEFVAVNRRTSRQWQAIELSPHVFHD